MVNKSDIPVSSNYFLRQGYILIADKPMVISTVLGSCVSVCLYDRKRKAGGMNHFQLPSTKRSDGATARYGNVATLTLIGMMVDGGSRIKHLEAQIFGGAFNPEISAKDVGKENIRVAIHVLRKKGIHIVSEDVGGERGRKIVFDTNRNEIAIIRVDQLRKGDWYPYEETR